MKKLYIIFAFALALFASVFVCGRASAQTVCPWDVDVSVEFGGKTVHYRLSEEADDDSADMRGFYLGAQAKQRFARQLLQSGLPARAVCNYILPNFDKVINAFEFVECSRADSVVSFGKNGFSYSKSRDGVQINLTKLLFDALNSGGNHVEVKLPVIVDKAVTAEQLKRNTVCRGTFCTSFATSGANRSHNVKKAAETLNGVTVGVGEKFSFNQAVGNRTESNGYKTSKIILDGAYTDGVGGGVCQVSTTLYNALLLAGFVPSAVPHTLVSSYVKEGFDAMVSYGSADLTFVNTTDHPIYISSSVADKKLTFCVYGEPNPYKIVRESTVTREKFATEYVVDREKYPELIYENQTKVIVGGSDGVKSKSYLNYYLDGKLVCRKLLRTDSYKRVDAVIAKGYLPCE